MSNHLAIATVTATLQQTLQTAVGATVSGATVKTLRPEVSGNGAPEAHVNLYLYQVTPNANWRNADLPTRNSSGTLVDRPAVALDLYYLLSFYGDEGKLEPQRLLGSVARALHDRPVLTRQMIRDTIASPSFDFLVDSDLADAVELVKLTPIALSLEELSKLWSVFLQTPYTLSVAYQGAVVLIESEASHQRALPVRERRLYMTTLHQPVIETVRAEAGPDQPIVAGTTLVIRGYGLRGELTQLRIGSAESVTPTIVSETELTMPLSQPPLSAGSLRAGVQGLQVIHPVGLGTSAAAQRGVESNLAAFVLRPTILAVTASSPQASVTAQLMPSIGQTQRVVLLLNELGNHAPRAYRFPAPPLRSDTDSVTIPVRGVKPGEYLVRVQIDGAESPLTADATGQYNGPTVMIP